MGAPARSEDVVKPVEEETANESRNKTEGTMTVENKEVAAGGAFLSSLKRNNAQIRGDRALAISEDAEMIYKREVEDLELQIKKMKREQESMLDLSPENAMTLKLASDFDAKAYVVKDQELSIKIHNAEIALELSQKRYEYLFGAE